MTELLDAKTKEDMKIFIEHVKNMRDIVSRTPEYEDVEPILYGYIEACRFIYGENALLTKWIEVEYYAHVKD